MGQPSNEDKMFAMLIYLLSFVTALIGPLIIWLIKRDDSYFVDFHGKQYLNFFISYIIYGIVAGILSILLFGLPAIALVIAGLIFTILAAVKSFQGEYYEIPFLIRFLK